MIIKCYEAESSLLPSGAFFHNINAIYLPVRLEVFTDVVLLCVLLDAANKYLLHCQMGTWFIGVLKENENQSAHTKH